MDDLHRNSLVGAVIIRMLGLERHMWRPRFSLANRSIGKIFMNIGEAGVGRKACDLGELWQKIVSGEWVIT